MRLGFFELLFLIAVGYVIYLIVNARGSASRSGVECPKCKQPMPATANFCMNCGTVLKSVTHFVPCPSCGELGRPDGNFCRRCGAQVQSKAV